VRKNNLKKILKANQTATNAWLAIASSYSAELVANCGFDSVTVDLQHGMIDFAQALTMLQAISTTNATPLVRPTSSTPVEIMRLLDAGAYGVICPQVDTVAIAESVVAACRYPPVGARSYGPPRGTLYGGSDYQQYANDEILIFIMIESRKAVENLDNILDVKGIDGIFIGPNDLSLSFGGGVGADPQGELPAIIESIRKKAAERHLFTGIYSSDGKMARGRANQGFQLVNPGNDSGLLKNACEVQLAAIQDRKSQLPSPGY